MLDVSGGGAHTQTLIWVGGAGSAAWPELPDQRLELTADRDSYKAGDTAKIFIPNPFATNSLALVTVERGLVSRADVLTLSGSGNEYSVELTEGDAPNVYVSVTVLGQGNDFRYGLVNLPVTPDAQSLNVQVASNPTQAGPRDEVTFDVQVTDHQGQPVQGEFSLSVVDLATLALADPNAEDILPAFYKEQPLGIETGLSVAAYTGRNATEAGGGGGGGGEESALCARGIPRYCLLESSAGHKLRRARPGDHDPARLAHHLAGGCSRLDRGYESRPGGNADRGDEASAHPPSDTALPRQRRPCADGGNRQQQYRG